MLAFSDKSFGIQFSPIAISTFAVLSTRDVQVFEIPQKSSKCEAEEQE